MLKFILKIMLVAFILFALGQYASYLMTAQTSALDIQAPAIPDITLSEMTEEISSSISKKIKLIKAKANKDEKEYIYKWRDNNGVIHYTSEQPPADVNYESFSYQKETNVVPAIRPDSRPAQSPPASASPFPDNVYSVEGVEQPFNQAKDIQNQVNQQFSQQQQIINSE